MPIAFPLPNSTQLVAEAPERVMARIIMPVKDSLAITNWQQASQLIVRACQGCGNGKQEDSFAAQKATDL